MARFRYVALDGTGALRRGTIDAADEASVIDLLQRQGQIPMRAEPIGEGGRLTELLSLEFRRRRGLSAADVANVTRELATMLRAGQDLDAGLRFTVETAASARVGEVMRRIRDKVRGGSSLAAALAQEPASFRRLYVSLVRAGEAGGKLGETLERLAALLERQRKLAASIQSALIYPSLLAVAAVASIAFLLTTVLPEFVPLFQQSGAELPTATRILIGLGTATSRFGPWLLLLLLVSGLAAWQALKRERARRAFDRWLLQVPFVGKLLGQVLAARFSRTLGTMLVNGVPLISALGIVKDTMGNLAAAEAVERATTSARGGSGLAEPLAESRIFPARLIHLLRLGEQTAQLGPIALKAAEIHEDESQIAVQRWVALLVPAITITMGAAVAFIVGSLLLAMLSLNDLAG